MSIEKVVEKIKLYDPKANIEKVREAYEFAAEAHKNDKRVSGEPFIIHPLATANILADFKMDEDSICAALLHDVVEDTGTTLDIIEKRFGKDVAMLVDGVTKITELKKKSREEYQAESLRKMLFATAKDIRVLIIKLCDKLHNMRTLGALPIEKRKRIAKETMDIYTPLAYRLGIDVIKSELEDLAFKVLNPQMYYDIEEKIKKNRSEREYEANRIAKNVGEILKNNYAIEAKIFGRAKTIYSIWHKMQRKNRTFEEIYDVIGIRIITGTVEECYRILGIIHNLWKPIPRRMKDYIALPKVNMYQSLHTIVIDEKGKIVEIQIRTEEMDRLAEEGIAAHWEYKNIKTDTKFDKKLSWLRQVLDWQQGTTTSKEFVESLEIDFFKSEIYTFTPKGKVIELPKSATPIDFAYTVHTQIGDQCIGAKVNGALVPLRSELKTGDIVEILTSKSQRPNRKWLKIVKTNKAKQKIRKYLHEMGELTVKSSNKVEEAPKRTSQNILIAPKIKNPKFKISKCCNPLPGDEIVSYVSKTNTVTIHKKNCEQIDKLPKKPKKRTEVKWREDYNDVLELNLETVDRVGLFADVLNTIANTGTNVQSANAKITGPNNALCSFKVVIDDLTHLRDLIRKVMKVNGVKKIFVGRIGV